MATNELDAAFEDAFGQKPLDPMAQAINDQKNEDVTRLKVAAQAVADVHPDQKAEAMKIASSFKVPTAFVEQNFDQLKREHKSQAVDFDRMVNESPELAQWLGNEDHAALAKDDMENVQGLAKTVKDLSAAEKMYASLSGGLATLNLNAAQAPAYLWDFALAPQNALMKAVGRPDLQARAPEWTRENAVSDFFSRSRDQQQEKVPELSSDVVDLLSQGEGKKASTAILYQVVNSAPTSVALLVANYMGAGVPGLVGAGVLSASGKAAEGAKEGRDPLLTTIDATASGTAEAAFEKLGTLAVVKKIEKSIVSKFGKDTWHKILKDMSVQLGLGAAQESVEEMGTSVAQDLSGAATGGNPDMTLSSVAKNAANAGIVGFASSAPISAPFGALGARQRMKEMNDAKRMMDFHAALGDSAQKSKLRARLPDAHNKLIEKLTKDGPVENVHMPVEDFQTYFQSKGLDPQEMAQKLGLADLFNEAKETGGDIKVPLGTFVDKFSGTEHYQGLAGDVKYSPDALTYNQAQRAEAQLEKELEEYSNATDETQSVPLSVVTPTEETSETTAEALKPDAKPKTPEQIRASEARQVKADVKRQLLEMNNPLIGPNEAEQYAMIHGAQMLALSSRSAYSPMEIYQRHALKIRTKEIGDVQLKREGMTAAQGQTLEQRSLVKMKDGDLSGEIKGKGNISGTLMGADGAGFWFEGGNKTIEDVPYDLFAILEHVEVDPSARRQGVASNLVKDFEKSAIKNGAEAIYLNASPVGSNQIAVGNIVEFYKSHGFEVFDDMGTNVIMVKALDKKAESRELFQSDAALAVQDQYPPGPAPVTFSKVIRTVEQKMGGSASPEQILAMLKDTREEERKWLGLEEFVKGKTKIKKQELLDFLNANAPQIVDVTLGDKIDSSGYKIVVGPAGSPFPFAVQNSAGETRQSFKLLEDAENFIDGGILSPDKATKYEQYTLPGGENYREVLFTLPRKEDNSVSLRMDEIEQELTSASGPVAERDALRSEYAELARTKKDRTHTDFSSGHFDEKNILAHVRLNDRTDADGKKVLFVEEIQSDWHQAGRKKGYKGDAADSAIDALEKEEQAHQKVLSEWLTTKSIPVEAHQRVLRLMMEKGYDTSGMPESAIAALDGFRSTNARLYEATQSRSVGAVPDAPFRKTWHEYAMKRIIRMAAEQGYERVAWTRGEQQSARFSLDKSISTIQYNKNTKTLFAEGLNGQVVIDENNVDEARLEAVVGKEVAEKLLQPENALENKRGEPYLHELSGENLKVESKGMRGFYDKILVDYANKLGKKFGAKVGETQIDSSENDLVYYISENTQGTFGVFKPEPGSSSIPRAIQDREFKTKAEAERFRDSLGVGTKVHSLDITPQMKESALGQGFELFQNDSAAEAKEPNAAINISAAGQMEIDLFRKANLSSFLHETGHFYLEVIDELVKDPRTSQRLKDDYDTIREWLGAKPGEKLTVDQHEKWARGFETYLGRGVAPTPELRNAFKNFRLWLTAIYGRLIDLKVELTPEITDVMNRLMATDEQLADAVRGQPSLLDNDTAKMLGGKDYETYSRLQDDEKRSMSEDLTAKVMQHEMQKREAAYKAARKEVMAKVEAEANQMRAFKALAILQRGKMADGSPVPVGMEGLKLDRDTLVAAYGKEFLERLPRPFIYAKTGGIHFNLAAEMLGYESGDAMLKSLEGMPSKKEYIERETNREMEIRFPDEIMEKFPEEAVKAAHTDARRKRLYFELEMLAKNSPAFLKTVIKKVVARVPREADVKALATRMIAAKKIEDIKPYQFERAERKAAKEAGIALAKGDLAAAFEAKRKELLNYELFKAATEAHEAVEKAEKFFKKFKQKDEDLAKTRDTDLVNVGRAILALHGIGKTDKTPADYLANMKKYDAVGYDSAVAIIANSDLDPGPVDEITYDQFANLVATLESIWDLSKQSRNIMIDGKMVDREDMKAEIIAQTTSVAGPTKQESEKFFTLSEGEKKGLSFLSMRASLTRAEHWFTAMDRGSRSGAFTKYFMNPIREALTKYRIEKKNYITEAKALLDPISATLGADVMIAAPELGQGKNFRSKAELLGAILHTGNDSNLHKLLVGYGWGEKTDDGVDSANWDQFVQRMWADGTLTKADYDAVQGVWDLMERLKPDTQKAHKQMFGFYFNEITSKEIVTPWGTYRGGYMPAKTDPYTVDDAARRADENAVESRDNTFAFPTTGRGATKSRVENYTAKLQLDIRLSLQHIDWALRFTYLEPRVKELGRLATDPEFRAAMKLIDPEIVSGMIVPWLQRVAKQNIMASSASKAGRAWDKRLGLLRSRASLQMMAFNFVNALQNFTALFPVALRVKPSIMMGQFWRFTKSPKATVAFVAEKSQFMSTRLGDQARDIQQEIEGILENPSAYVSARDWAVKHAQIFQVATQNTVDAVVWTSAYSQEIERGATEKEAVRAADAMVTQAIGGMNAEDVSSFEANTAIVRALTMFYTFFNNQANFLGADFVIHKELGLQKRAGRAFYAYTLVVMAPAIVGALIQVLMAGKGLDEDDDGEYLDDLFEALFMSQFKYMTAMIPGGSVANSVMNRFNDKAFDDRISVSPIISTLEKVGSAPFAIAKAFDGGKSSTAIKDSLSAVGFITGFPGGAIARPLGYFADVAEGEASPTGPVDFARGTLTGKPGATH